MESLLNLQPDCLSFFQPQRQNLGDRGLWRHWKISGSSGKTLRHEHFGRKNPGEKTRSKNKKNAAENRVATKRLCLASLPLVSPNHQARQSRNPVTHETHCVFTQ